MLNWYCAVVMIVLTVEQCIAIRCYSCSSRNDDSCLRPYRNNIQLKKCGLPELNETKVYAEQVDPAYSSLFQVDIQSQDPQVPMNCLKQVTKVGSREVVIRGCQLAASDNLDICVKVKELTKDALHTPYCTLCNSDGCNGGNFTIPHLPALVLALLYPLLSNLLN